LLKIGQMEKEVEYLKEINRLLRERDWEARDGGIIEFQQNS
jgi:hypothetical protein